MLAIFVGQCFEAHWSGMVKTMVKWFNINPYHRSLNLEDISPVYLVLNDHPAKVEMSCCPNSTCFNLCRFMPKLIRRPKAALASWLPIAEPEPPKIIVFQLLEDTSGDYTFCGSTRSSIAFAFTSLQCGVARLYPSTSSRSFPISNISNIWLLYQDFSKKRKTCRLWLASSFIHKDTYKSDWMATIFSQLHHIKVTVRPCCSRCYGTDCGRICSLQIASLNSRVSRLNLKLTGFWMIILAMGNPT